MFSLITFLAILINLLPLGGMNFKPVDLVNDNVAIHAQADNFPTPTGIQKAIDKIAQVQDENSGNQRGFMVDPQPEHGNDMNQPVAHNVVIKDSDPSPTPSLVSPEPTTRPMPEITHPQTPPKDHSEVGCPPCGGGNGKFECPMVMCMY